MAHRQDDSGFEALLARGTAALHDGRGVTARDLLRAAVRHDPGSATAQARLGLACQMTGDDAAAIAPFTAALAAAPGMTEARYGLATALNAAGRRAEALASFDALVAAAPALPEAQYGRAATLHALGRHREAAEGFAAAVALDGEFVEAIGAQAGALLAAGDPAASVACCERALGIDPDFLQPRLVLAAALAATRRFGEAIAQWREVLALAPDQLEPRLSLARTLLSVGRAEEALAQFEAALPRLHDDQRRLAEAETGRAQALLELGRLAAAEQGFERAIALRPDDLGAPMALVNARRVRPDDALVPRMEALAARRTTLPLAEQVVVCFIMHKIATDLGDPARGFAFLMEGAALRRGQLPYDEDAALANLCAPRRVFTPALMARHAGAGDPSDVPIFIVGMPRSGSTLIEQVLASHPRVVGGGERSDFAAALHGAIRREGTDARSDDFIAALSAPALRRMAAAYLERLDSAAAGAKRNPARITDKLLENFRYVGLIHLALPNARFIHTRRDPVDTCLSSFSKLFAAPQPHTYDLGTLGRYWREYDRLMAHWRTLLPQGAMLEVQYEDVVADFETQARRVVAHCGLDWDDACLSFHTTARPVRTASVVQVRQPIYRTSVGRWRPDAATLRPLLDGLGLEPPA